MAYVEIQKNQFERIFENVYRWQKKLFRPVIKNFIDDFILDKIICYHRESINNSA